MDLNLKDKVVVITGGAGGIGEEAGKLFMAEGCSVAVCDNNQEKVDAFNKKYADKSAFAGTADISDQDSLIAFADSVASRFGGIDIWINNAGIYTQGSVMDMPVELWKKTFDVNVNGVFYATKAAVPYMRKRGGGVILNAATYATITPSVNRGAYGASKAAVANLTRVMAAELAPDNIRVLAYSPGFIVSDMTKDSMAFKNSQIFQLALHRQGQVDDVATVLVFLASDGAKFMTGSNVDVSGGRLCVQNPGIAWENKE